MAPKYCGPATIIEVNESVAKIRTDKNKLKTLNVNKLKLFQDSDADAPETDTDAPETDADSNATNQDLIKFDPSMRRPLTRAWSKLIKSDAISALITKTDASSPEEIWYKLNSIAFKLYHLNLEFNQLTSEELKFWKQFKQEDIFEWLSGSSIHPPDEYIRIRSTVTEGLPLQLQQPIQQPGPNVQPGPAPPNPPPGPSPRKPGRQPGLKNNFKDPLTRAAHYASKRFTRAASKVFSPDTARKNANAPF